MQSLIAEKIVALEETVKQLKFYKDTNVKFLDVLMN